MQSTLITMTQGLATSLLTLLLLLAGIGEARAYPKFEGPVINTGRAFSDGQVAGLQQRLRELEAEIGVRGVILALPAQETWDLNGYTIRTLEEWQAQGVLQDRCFLLVLIPDQHRMALALDPALTDALDTWTARTLSDRISVMCEQGELYNASQMLLTNLSQSTELQPKPPLRLPVNWVWIAIGIGVLALTGWRSWFMRRTRTEAFA